MSHNSPPIPEIHSIDVWPTTSMWLRAETREAHVAAEVELDVGRLCDRADLAGLLRGWDAVWAAVWSAVSAPTACQEARDELLFAAGESRRWIRSDLAELGTDLVDSPDAESGGRLASLLVMPASSWGVAYVLRGARLGGAVLAPRLRAQLGLPSACGMSFLQSAGTSPAREWAAFRRRLDGQQRSFEEMAGAVEAARWTFGWVTAMTQSGLSAVSS